MLDSFAARIHQYDGPDHKLSMAKHENIYKALATHTSNPNHARMDKQVLGNKGNMQDRLTVPIDQKL